MRFLLDKIHELKCGWNDRPLCEDDFYRLCIRNKVTVQEMPLRVSGFYYCLQGGHYIAIDSKLPHREKLFVMFHEFAHYLLHVPDTGITANFHGIGLKTRKEKEADMFALCALIPRSWLDTSAIQSISELEGIPREMLAERLEIYEKYRI